MISVDQSIFLTNITNKLGLIKSSYNLCKQYNKETLEKDISFRKLDTDKYTYFGQFDGKLLNGLFIVFDNEKNDKLPFIVYNYKNGVKHGICYKKTSFGIYNFITYFNNKKDGLQFTSIYIDDSQQIVTFKLKFYKNNILNGLSIILKSELYGFNDDVFNYINIINYCDNKPTIFNIMIRKTNLKETDLIIKLYNNFQNVYDLHINKYIYEFIDIFNCMKKTSYLINYDIITGEYLYKGYYEYFNDKFIDYGNDNIKTMNISTKKIKTVNSFRCVKDFTNNSFTIENKNYLHDYKHLFKCIIKNYINMIITNEFYCYMIKI